MKDIIAFTGGGTGGHVYPALAVLEELKYIGKYKFYWIGSKGIEKKIVKDFSVRYFTVPSGKLRRYFSLRNFFDIFKVFGGFISCLFIFIFKRPALLFSKGGFVSVPPVLAAYLLGIPVFTHESDSDPGLATKINSIFAKKIFVAYESTKKYFKDSIKPKVFLSGNPVRKDIFKEDFKRTLKDFGINPKRKNIFILGGSLGAKEINDLVLAILPELCTKYNVIHQTGHDGITNTTMDSYYPFEYLKDEYPLFLSSADLVISRAGAGALWEISSKAKPAIFIPLRGSGTRGDQLRNAELFEEKGAAKVLKSDKIKPEDLLSLIREILENEELGNNLSKNIKDISKIDSLKILTDHIIQEASNVGTD